MTSTTERAEYNGQPDHGEILPIIRKRQNRPWVGVHAVVFMGAIRAHVCSKGQAAKSLSIAMSINTDSGKDVLDTDSMKMNEHRSWDRPERNT